MVRVPVSRYKDGRELRWFRCTYTGEWFPDESSFSPMGRCLPRSRPTGVNCHPALEAVDTLTGRGKYGYRLLRGFSLMRLSG